jgi:hypothetical protein
MLLLLLLLLRQVSIQPCSEPRRGQATKPHLLQQLLRAPGESKGRATGDCRAIATTTAAVTVTGSTLRDNARKLLLLLLTCWHHVMTAVKVLQSAARGSGA